MHIVHCVRQSSVARQRAPASHHRRLPHTRSGPLPRAYSHGEGSRATMRLLAPLLALALCSLQVCSLPGVSGQQVSRLRGCVVALAGNVEPAITAHSFPRLCPCRRRAWRRPTTGALRLKGSSECVAYGQGRHARGGGCNVHAIFSLFVSICTCVFHSLSAGLGATFKACYGCHVPTLRAHPRRLL